MKKINKLFLTLTLLIVTVASIHAQNSATATGISTAKLVAPITLTWEQPLAFGLIIPSGTDGTACMKVTGLNVNSSNYIAESPTPTNVVALTTTNSDPYGGNPHPGPAVFEVTGQLNWTFGITIPTNAVPCHLIDLNPGGAPDLIVKDFQSGVGSPSVVSSTGTLSVGIGIQDFVVGATLYVPANTLPGRYQGQFQVTAYYN